MQRRQRGRALDAEGARLGFEFHLEVLARRPERDGAAGGQVPPKLKLDLDDFAGKLVAMENERSRPDVNPVDEDGRAGRLGFEAQGLDARGGGGRRGRGRGHTRCIIA